MPFFNIAVFRTGNDIQHPFTKFVFIKKILLNNVMCINQRLGFGINLGTVDTCKVYQHWINCSAARYTVNLIRL